MTAPNIERLDHLLEWAEGEAEKQAHGLRSEWDQAHWAAERPKCGTVCCLFGKAGLEDGLEPIMREWSTVPTSATAAEFRDPATGLTWDPQVYGQEALGLTHDQALALSDSQNNLEDIRRIIADIKAGELFPLSGEEYREHVGE